MVRCISSERKPKAIGRTAPVSAATSYNSLTMPSIRTECGRVAAARIDRLQTATRERPVRGARSGRCSWRSHGRGTPNSAWCRATLAKQGDDFRRLLEPRKGDVVFGLATFMNEFDISTAYPLLLFLLDVGLSAGDWKAISTALESYLLRRAVLGWTTKAYSRIFLNLTKAMRKVGPTPQTLIAFLSGLQGDSTAWPMDEVFSEAWKSRPAYEILKNPKLVPVLGRLSETYLNNRNEQLTIDGPLSVEHIMPQNWSDHWPLSSGEKGLTSDELREADSDDPRTVATRHRDNALQTMGNLTILTQALNSSVSNSAWMTKKPELLKSSLLPINPSSIAATAPSSNVGSSKA